MKCLRVLHAIVRNSGARVVVYLNVEVSVGKDLSS